MSDGICTVPKCVNDIYAGGLCSPHYQRVLRYGDPRADKPLLKRAARGTKGPECAVPGCLRPEHTRGWCGAHYERWLRHGDPLLGRVMQGESRAYFLAQLPLVTEGCKLWPYSTTAFGYGYFQHDKVKYLVHVLACEAAHGPPPFVGAEATHGPCHDAGCFAGGHLSWRSHFDNMQDLDRDGTRVRGEQVAQAKLTADDVRSIRVRRTAGESRLVLAAEFGLHPEYVTALVARKTWRHIL